MGASARPNLLSRKMRKQSHIKVSDSDWVMLDNDYSITRVLVKNLSWQTPRQDPLWSQTRVKWNKTTRGSRSIYGDMCSILASKQRKAEEYRLIKASHWTHLLFCHELLQTGMARQEQTWTKHETILENPKANLLLTVKIFYYLERGQWSQHHLGEITTQEFKYHTLKMKKGSLFAAMVCQIIHPFFQDSHPIQNCGNKNNVNYI